MNNSIQEDIMILIHIYRLTLTSADDIKEGLVPKLSNAFTVTSANFGSDCGSYCRSLTTPLSGPTENMEDCLISYCTIPKLLLSLSVAYYDDNVLMKKHFKTLAIATPQLMDCSLHH